MTFSPELRPPQIPLVSRRWEQFIYSFRSVRVSFAESGRNYFFLQLRSSPFRPGEVCVATLLTSFATSRTREPAARQAAG